MGKTKPVEQEQQWLTEEGLLDKDVILKGAPLPVKMALGPAIDFLNNLDVNKNKKRDFAELAPYIRRVVPFFLPLLACINWGKVLQNLLDNFTVPGKESEAAKLCDSIHAVAEEAHDNLLPKE